MTHRHAVAPTPALGTGVPVVKPRPAALLLSLALALGACGQLDEWKKQARRREAETSFVADVDRGLVDGARQSLVQDPTLANSVQTLRGRKSDYRGKSALNVALEKGRRDLVDLLFEFGADPNKADGFGVLPLQAALSGETGRGPLVALLLEKGADPERAGGGGTTALHAAASTSHQDDAVPVLRLLLDRARSTGAPDANGRLPIHLAAGGSNDSIVRILVEHGADPNARTAAPKPGEGTPFDVPGSTPLGLVAADRQLAAAAMLCALGADPDLEDSTGASAREVAERETKAFAARKEPVDIDLARHRSMAAFLGAGGGCDRLLARKRAGEVLEEAEVLRLANEGECDAGWGWACGQAGWAFHKGEGGARDDARALALFRRGCESALTTNVWCCGMAGILTVDGEGAPKDSVEGARLLALGCEAPAPDRADAQACNRLGVLYAEGDGVTEDMGRARALFHKACEQGSDRACANVTKYAGG